ncbi:MAG: GDP-mannose 4,6-dehydratase [Armatimonadetes bacterium]|nr:GDP-mannose 4,6-dehydratase [Armatimonadota bacterium]
MQLPLPRFKHFMEGYRVGDGTHSGKNVGVKLNFVTVSEKLASDLTYALLRFGVVASLGKYTSRIKSRPGKTYPFFSLTAQGLSSYDILTWDTGVSQRLNAGRFGDLVWATITAIEPVETTPMVYDFSVPDCENFVAGTGVLAHNTYGERMRLSDGRVVPNFVGQALRGDPITVYGTGQQTRSFCYVSDLLEGIYRLSMSEHGGPMNCGNPTERTMLEFAEEIKKATGSDSPIVFEPLPTADDPKQRKPDISKAKEWLGWEPVVSLEEGLKRTIAYFKTVL